MKLLDDYLRQYGAYHRDRRNLLTHLVGIPLIVVAVTTLLSRPSLVGITPAMLLAFASAVFYWRVDVRYGGVLAVLLALSVMVGQHLAALPTVAWLCWGIGLFVVGWAFQFIGHAFEGRKPAFVDDVVGLLVGPLFVVAEVGFVLGWRREVRERL